MDDIIIHYIINHGSKSLSKVTAFLAGRSKHLPEEFEIRFEIREFKFCTVNSKDVVIVSEFSVIDIFVKNINGKVKKFSEKRRLYTLTGFRNSLFRNFWKVDIR